MPFLNTDYFTTAVRQLSNLENDPIVTDVEIRDRVNEALADLYDLIIASYEHYFVKTVSFTLAGGVGSNTYALPTDFYKDISLDLNPTTTPSTVHRFTSWVDRNNLTRRSYVIEGTDLVVGPAQIASGNFMLSYTPLPPVLAPVTQLDTSGGAVDGTLESWFFATAAFVAGDVGSFLTVSGAANDANNGTFPITAVSSATDIITGLSDPTSESFGPDVVASYSFGTVEVLPPVFAPWYEFIQVHAAIAVKDKIEQSTDDLRARLGALTARIQRMAANRMEEGGQIALPRAGGGWWDQGTFPGGGGGDF